jgi:hypothetical protein
MNICIAMSVVVSSSSLCLLSGTVEMDGGPYRQYNPADGVNMPRDPGTGGYQDSVDSFDSGLRRSNNRTQKTGGSFAPPPPFRKPGPDFYSAPFQSRGQSQSPYGYNHHGAPQYDFPQTTAPPTAFPAQDGGFG